MKQQLDNASEKQTDRNLKWAPHIFICVFVQTVVCMHMHVGLFVRACLCWLISDSSVIAAVSLWLERWLRCWLLALFGHKLTRNWTESTALHTPRSSERDRPLSVPDTLSSTQRTLCCVNKASKMKAATMSIVICSYCVSHVVKMLPWYPPGISTTHHTMPQFGETLHVILQYYVSAEFFLWH